MELKFKIFIISCFVTTSVISQNLATVIDSVSGNAIPDVMISDRTVSNAKGEFSLSLFNNDDTLSFQHLVYNSKKVSFQNLNKSHLVKLSPKSISTAQVNVEGSVPLISSANIRERIELDGDSKAQYSNSAEVLKARTSLMVKDYGGDVGMKTVSSRGMSSENTTILFNEARVNDLRTGSFDFTMLDVFLIDKIEYVKNSSGSGVISSGGTLKIYSENINSESSITAGTMFNSNQTQNYFTSIKSAKNNFSFGLNFTRSFSSNKYNYNFEEKIHQRENANYSKTFVSGDVKWSTDKLIIKFYTHYSHLLNGLPGYVVTNNYASSKASNLTNAWLNIANINYSINKRWFFNSTLSYHNQFLKLDDPKNQLFVNRTSQSSTFNNFSAMNTLTFNEDNFEYMLGYNFTYAHVDSLTAYVSGNYNSNSAKRIEHNFSASGSYLIRALGFNKIIFSGGLNYQLIDEDIFSVNNYDYLSYRIGMVFTHSYLPMTDFILSFSDNYRHPTFNERYYSTLYGASKLVGEKYRSFNAGFTTEYNLLGRGKFDLTYFSIFGDNKIVWTPTRLALQVPSNIKEIESSGIELKVNESFMKNIFNIEFIYTYTDARNKSAVSPDDNSYNKLLIYTPEHQWNLNGVLKLYNFRFTANTTFVSERFYTSDNSPRNRLPHYFLLDLSLSYKFNINSFENRITINAYNILDEDYFIIQSYPMPLKTLSINYQVRFL